MSRLGTSLRTTPVQSPVTATTTASTVVSASVSVTQQTVVTSRPPQSPLVQARSAATTETGRPQVTGKNRNCIVWSKYNQNIRDVLPCIICCCVVLLKFTDVSEEKPKQGLFACCLLHLADSLTLKVELSFSSETPYDFQQTIPEYRTIEDKASPCLNSHFTLKSFDSFPWNLNSQIMPVRVIFTRLTSILAIPCYLKDEYVLHSLNLKFA
jgi:hypothetical protein